MITHVLIIEFGFEQLLGILHPEAVLPACVIQHVLELGPTLMALNTQPDHTMQPTRHSHQPCTAAPLGTIQVTDSTSGGAGLCRRVGIEKMGPYGRAVLLSNVSDEFGSFSSFFISEITAFGQESHKSGLK